MLSMQQNDATRPSDTSSAPVHAQADAALEPHPFLAGFAEGTEPAFGGDDFRDLGADLLGDDDEDEHQDSGSTWTAVGIVAGLAALFGILNHGSVPGFAVAYAVPLVLAVSVLAVAIRWYRRGVRREAGRALARKAGEFGGGVYGTVAMATFFYLEAADLWGEAVAAGSIPAFVGSLSLGWLIAQAVESVGFMISAMVWPFYWFPQLGVKTAVMVAAGIWAFDGVLKGGMRWLATRRERTASRVELG
jgi:hypothetical protein